MLVCVAAAPEPAQAATAEKTAEKTAAAAPEADVLELPEVLGAAAADLLKLREFELDAAAPGKTQEIDEQLRDPERSLTAKIAEAKKQIAAGRLRDLEDLEGSWRRVRRDLESWRDVVTQRALELQRDIEKVDALRERWGWARGEARRLEAPAPVNALCKH